MICGQWTERFLALEAAVARHRPVLSCDHLRFLAVTPAPRRSDLATALLRHRLPDLDRRGDAAFLEETTPTNIEMYQRNGFHVLTHDAGRGGLAPYRAPDGLTTITPMWRDPHPV